MPLEVKPILMNRIAVDLTFMPKSPSGNLYILTVVDQFSRYAWAVALSDKIAATIEKCLIQIILSEGAYLELQSDRGKLNYSNNHHI
jgi:transposase InsO family protein